MNMNTPYISRILHVVDGKLRVYDPEPRKTLNAYLRLNPGAAISKDLRMTLYFGKYLRIWEE